MPVFDTNYLLVSLLWGAIGAGCIVYGKKQGAAVPLIGGFALVGISYLVNSALLLSFLSFALIGAMYWGVKRGY